MWKSTINGIYHQLLIMLPVGPTGSSFSCWAPATKHLAFIFNHTSLSTNNAGKRQRPYLIRQTEAANIHTEKNHSNAHKPAKKGRLWERFLLLKWLDLFDERQAPPILCFLSECVLSCAILFLLNVFQFKEQQKQTEANPLSSQQPLAGYQLRVIVMSHSSGAS